jgi:hypothetical protein
LKQLAWWRPRENATRLSSFCIERPLLVRSPRTLTEILLSASALSGDRRKVWYPRLCKAVADGLEDKVVLSAKQVPDLAAADVDFKDVVAYDFAGPGFNITRNRPELILGIQ